MQNNMLKIKVIMLILGVIGSIIGILILYYIHLTYNIGLICIYNKITGLYCPGCGMTRAVYSLLNLDIYQAIRYNVFAVILLPILIIYFCGGIYAWLFNTKNYIQKIIPTKFWVIFAILLILYGAIRNVPYFSYLAPTVIR